MMTKSYTTKLAAGQGIIEETISLLDLWQPGMDANTLCNRTLSSGQFHKLSARRVRNLVVEGFAYRYLNEDGTPAIYLKRLKEYFSSREFNQLLYLYTCRAHCILYDFVTQVYWDAYSSAKDSLSIRETREFVNRAQQDGKTSSPWSEKVILRMSSYLNGTLADFGLLDHGKKGIRKILSFRIEPRVFVYIAYDLHLNGHADNSVLIHPDWGLFGMDRLDTLNEFKRLALNDWWIIQSAGNVTRIDWRFSLMEELIDAFAER